MRTRLLALGTLLTVTVIPLAHVGGGEIGQDRQELRVEKKDIHHNRRELRADN
jgi:hypothetical protein